MSRNLCCVKNCKNTKHEKPRLTFHNFPTKEPERCKKWIEFCENQTLTELFSKNDPKVEHKSICSEHFEDNKYNNPLKKIRLMCNAIPTLRPNQKKQTVNTIQCQPQVQVIPAQVLLRTNLSRSWRPPKSPKIGTSCEQANLTNVRTENPSQQNWSALKPKANPIMKQYSGRQFSRHLDEIKSLREQLAKSKKQVMNLKYRLKRCNPIGNTRKSKMNYIIKTMKSLNDDLINPVMSEIIEYHLISAFLNKPRVPKWTNRMKKFCADLYHKSPTAYTFVQKTMTLPTKKTVLKFTENRIQIAKNETFKPTVCETNDMKIEENVNQMEDNFDENEEIGGHTIQIPNDGFNFTIEYKTSDQTNVSSTQTIVLNRIDVDSTADTINTVSPPNKTLTTKITLVDD